MNRLESFDGEQITEKTVIDSLNERGMEASLELFGAYIEQCEEEANAEYASSGCTAIDSYLANLRVSIKIARVYLGSNEYKHAGLESLRETQEAAKRHASAEELLREVELMILEAEARMSGGNN